MLHRNTKTTKNLITPNKQEAVQPPSPGFVNTNTFSMALVDNWERLIEFDRSGSLLKDWTASGSVKRVNRLGKLSQIDLLKEIG